MKEILSGRLRVEPDQIMGNSGLKTDTNSWYKSLFNTVKLYSTHSQFLVGKVSIKVPDHSKGCQISSQQKQTTQTCALCL